MLLRADILGRAVVHPLSRDRHTFLNVNWRNAEFAVAKHKKRYRYKEINIATSISLEISAPQPRPLKTQFSIFLSAVMAIPVRSLFLSESIDLLPGHTHTSWLCQIRNR